MHRHAVRPPLAPRTLAPRTLAPLVLLLAGACITGGSASPIVTDRPDFTESALTVPGGRIQMEAGATFAEARDADMTTLGEVLLRAGVSERVELRIGVPSYATVDYPVAPGVRSRDRGFTDANLGVKFALFAPTESTTPIAPFVGLIVGSTFPTGTGGLDAGGPQPEAKLLLAWPVTDRFSIASNLNYARVNGDGDDDYDQPSASLSGAFTLTPSIGSYLEVYGFAPNFDDAPRPTYLNGGLTWLVTSEFQLDARVGVGIADAPDASFVGIGFARRW